MKYHEDKGNSNLSKDYFIVDKIIARKLVGKKKLYLIKWKGYPVGDCSWEPISNLVNITNMVEDFDKNFPNSIDKRRLKKYLKVIKQRSNHIIKIKNPFFKKIVFKNEKNTIEDNIIICIDNNNLFNKVKEEKKEEEKENDGENIKETKEIIIDDNNIFKGSDKNNFDYIEKLNEFNSISDDKHRSELIRPIIAW
jgi:hypothetical protein